MFNKKTIGSLVLFFIVTSTIYSQGVDGDTLRKKIILDLCARILTPKTDNSRSRFYLLNLDLNYKSIFVGRQVSSERYSYRKSKFDSLLLKEIADRFSLQKEYNFFQNNDYHDYEYIAGVAVGEGSFLSINNFDSLHYFKVEKPLNDWDILYLLKDSAIYFKNYKQVDVKRKLFVNMPVVSYVKPASPPGLGTERKYIYQYEILFFNNQWDIKFYKRIDIE